MKDVKRFFSYGSLVTALFLILPSSAYALGQTTEENWHGVGSEAIQWGIDEDNHRLRPSVDASVESSLLDGALWAYTAPHDMHGYLDGSLAPNSYVGNDTFDEFYFTSGDGKSASIDLHYDFDFSMKIVDTTIPVSSSDMFFDLLLYADHQMLDLKSFYVSSEKIAGTDEYAYYMNLYLTNGTTPDDTIEMENGLFNFSESITLSTDGWYGAERGVNGLVDSGTYLPFTVEILAEDDSGNLIIDYRNSFKIDDENPTSAFVLDDLGEKVELASSAYTLSSPENFKATATVPEPTTLILFGSGLVGAFIKRRKG